MKPSRVAVHQEPIWRERANFIIATSIDPNDTDVTTEQLWARQVDERQFELCCIPFFAYDLALGDVVETDDGFMVQGVSTPSGRYVFRVHFDHSNRFRDLITEQLESLGALVEKSSSSLLAVDARDLRHAKIIAGFLQQEEDLGRLIYETGKTA